jgi:hypothetical protein
LLYPALFGVAATSARDAWAVGQYQSASGPLRTLIMHWNGKAWTVMRSPVRIATLDGVAATSASNVWAVGFSGNWQASHALVLHWNGQAWRQVPAPDQPGNGIFWGVAATSARNAWVVSGAAQKALDVNKTVIEQAKHRSRLYTE